MDTQKELIAEYDRELASTRKMLDAIPADADLNWKPNPKCMTLGRLAAHVDFLPAGAVADRRGIDFASVHNHGAARAAATARRVRCALRRASRTRRRQKK